MLLRQHRIQARQTTAMLEQYLPLVDELIEQVRARQHDFNNQMMAVAAAVSTCLLYTSRFSQGRLFVMDRRFFCA